MDSVDNSVSTYKDIYLQSFPLWITLWIDWGQPLTYPQGIVIHRVIHRLSTELSTGLDNGVFCGIMVYTGGKMTRRQFTLMVGLLIAYVRFVCPYDPIIGDVKRSRQEQARVFKLKLSKRDGVKKISDHQTGKGIDLYLGKGRKLIWSRALYRKLHKFWELLGGKKMIFWDLSHFGG